ncbi:Nuclear receptor 2C2-associated protein [Coemansia sp. RSA 2618]|nr:Nuclear receptor 2C2-associated protein [Coemansia sp. RSA 2618]
MSGISLVKHISNYRVSSVLNRDVPSLGKQNLFDGSIETCWNSEQGTPQHILVEFSPSVRIHEIRVQFQGGFAGKDTRLVDLDRKREICPLFPEDNNKVQVLSLPADEQSVERRRIKLQFATSTDFYGRVIVYSLDFYGSVADEHSGQVKDMSGKDTTDPTSNSDTSSAPVITII